MMERGDSYKVAVCNTTGLLAIYNPAKNLFLSPMADGPIKFVGSLDGKDMNIENVSKYGRSFSVVSVPYSFKLLIQELQTINVQMRIITADNIDQIESMSFSRNLENLTGTMAANVLKHAIQTKLDKKPDYASLEAIAPSSPDFATPDYSTPAEPASEPASEPAPQPMASVGYPPTSYDIGTAVQYKGDGLIYTIVASSDSQFTTIKNDKGETRLVNKTDLYAPVFEPTSPSPPVFEPTSPSPALEPTSPSPALEAAPQDASPTGYPPSSYDVGTAVQYKGDGLIYKIVKVSDTLLTIQNENGESKLVSRTDLNAPPSPQAPLMVGGGVASGTNLYFAPSIMINGTGVKGGGLEMSNPVITTESDTQQPDSAPASMDGGAIDFSRLVIKKQVS
jgi:hypothetical protein